MQKTDTAGAVQHDKICYLPINNAKIKIGGKKNKKKTHSHLEHFSSLWINLSKRMKVMTQAETLSQL